MEPRADGVQEALECFPGTFESATEAPGEQLVNGSQSVFLEDACATSGDCGVMNDGLYFGFPGIACPSEPAVHLLVEHPRLLVAQFCEFGAPASAALDRVVVQDVAYDEDFLTVVDLMPDALEDASEAGGVRE